MEKTERKVKSTFEEMKILNTEVKMMSTEKNNAVHFSDLEKKEVRSI